MGGDFLDALKRNNQPTPTTPAAPLAGLRDGTAYARQALADEVARMVAIPIGSGRNHALNTAAFRMGQLVAAGHLDERTVIETLGAADGGLDFKATRDTIRSGIEAGKREGRAGIPSPVQEVPPWERSDDPFERGATGQYADTDGRSLRVSESTEPSDTEQRDAYVTSHFPLIDWHRIWTEKIDVEWIINPLLPARRLIALYSAPKVGKSLLMLELAMNIARGTRFLGYEPRRPFRVLYVDFENDPHGDIIPRLKGMAAEPEQLGNLCYLSLPTIGGFDSERGAVELLAAIDTYRCEVVVIDTVSRSVDGDENENDTWLKFYRHTGLKLKQAGVALIRLDHSGKDETKGQRGGSAKSGDVDAIWRMQRLTDGSDGQAESFRLTCDAHRFPIPVGEKTLTLVRRENPLRHEVRPTGSTEIIVDAIIAHLDSIDAPVGDGYRQYRLEDLRAAGIPGASQRTLTKAIDQRRRRASWTDEIKAA